MKEYNIKELEEMLDIKVKPEKKKKKRKKMKFEKKALVVAFTICIVLLLFTMAMVFAGKDTTSLSILATAGVGVLPILYGIYEHHSTKINLKHMEENYIQNYDDEKGIY